MGNESKIIRKTDDSAMALLHDILGEQAKKITDIDSYYNISGQYHFLEFIKCEKRPFEYDPNQNWNEISKHISTVFDFSKKADGILWLVCYDLKKDQFKLFKVKEVSSEIIQFEETKELNLGEFKAWFQKMNSDVLKK